MFQLNKCLIKKSTDRKSFKQVSMVQRHYCSQCPNHAWRAKQTMTYATYHGIQLINLRHRNVSNRLEYCTGFCLQNQSNGFSARFTGKTQPVDWNNLKLKMSCSRLTESLWLGCVAPQSFSIYQYFNKLKPIIGTNYYNFF